LLLCSIAVVYWLSDAFYWSLFVFSTSRFAFLIWAAVAVVWLSIALSIAVIVGVQPVIDILLSSIMGV
jgi:hypothetical protein